ncbi:MAG: hypothetical protein LUH22_07815 [Bacteroides sp.]|nr:hypothetical protein [Bacteroides sp.]
MENQLCGGYTAFRPITSDEEELKELFKKIVGPIVGAKHVPMAVASQVVRGTNYAFLCLSKVVRPDAEEYNTLVIIHQPLPDENEPPTLMEIRTVKII